MAARDGVPGWNCRAGLLADEDAQCGAHEQEQDRREHSRPHALDEPVREDLHVASGLACWLPPLVRAALGCGPKVRQQRLAHRRMG